MPGYFGRLSVMVVAVAATTICAVMTTADETQTTTQLRAGAASADITPPLGEMVVGGFKPFPAAEVHDNLYARCLVLDDGS